MSADTFSPPWRGMPSSFWTRKKASRLKQPKKLFQLFLFHETHNKAQWEIIIHSPDMENQISIVFDDFMFSWILPWKVGLHYKVIVFQFQGTALMYFQNK